MAATSDKGSQNQDSTESQQTSAEFPLAYTPVQLDAMEPFLLNYPDQESANKISSGFKTGFPLHYSGPNKSYEAPNLKSAIQHPDILDKKIQKEVQAGRVEGPFVKPPFANFRVSPLGLVPKKEAGEFRMIHDLSYPKGDSVNAHIDPKLCSVQYTKFDAAVHMVQKLGPGALLAKSDLKSAFRNLPVAKRDFPNLGFKFKGQYFFDKAMPFGCSISCASFEMFACFLEWAVRVSCSVGEIEHYLDDFLFGGEGGTNHCQCLLNAFISRCSSFGVPIADDKTVGPCTVLIFLGLEIDSLLMQVRIPQEKLKTVVEQITGILRHNRSTTLRELQSLLGSLNFMCRAIAPGRPFCRRLIDATCGVNSPHHHIRITQGMRLDLEMWLKFFRDFNGVSVFQDMRWFSNADVCLFTDSSAACDKGFGAYFQGHWTCAVWPESWVLQGLTKDITLLEYFPILVSIVVWGDSLRNKKVLFRCDNQSVVQVVNRQTSKSPELMVLVRELTLRCLKLNLALKAEHIPGACNGIADSLSRLQIPRFRTLAPEADKDPVPVPEYLWSIFRREQDSC